MRSSLPPPPLPSHAQPGSTVASTVRVLRPGTPPSEGWRHAAFALIRLNPKEGEALGLEFEDESASDETRLLVLDLLAGAGTFEAQVILRRLLALAVARRSNRTFATFVQRLGILECPDGPTLRFLMSVYAESRGEPHDVRASCAYALGAAAGQALAAGDPDAAVRASDVLRRDLLSAGTVIEKCALLTALGNAGVPSDVMVVTRFTQDPDAPVRSAAALAFRKLKAPEARANLLALLADSEPKVAQSALVALSAHTLDDTDFAVLAEMVLGGRTAIVLDARVLRLIVAQRSGLTTALGSAVQVENALRLLLGRVEAAGAKEIVGSGERRVANVAKIGATGSAGAMLAALPLPSMSQPSQPPPRPPHAELPTTTRTHRPARSVMSVKTLLQVQPPEPAMPPPPALTAAASIAAASYAATIMDQPAMPLAASGAYHIVNPGDTVEQVRARMAQLGLDPNARMSIIPQPPPRRMDAMPSVSSASRMPYPAPDAGSPATPLQVNAVARGR